MHELNREYLNHDYPTDVLSFVLDRQDDELQGEIIVSADTAHRAVPGIRVAGPGRIDRCI